jgi:hypothetical protein
MRGMDANRGPYIRIAVFVGIAALAVAGLYWAGTRLAPRRPPPYEAPTQIDYSEYIHPPKTERTASGEETAAFSGFALSVDSDPPGAVISVAGKVRGEAPVLADVPCSRDAVVEVRAEKAGFKPARHEVRCRADTLVKLTLSLQR